MKRRALQLKKSGRTSEAVANEAVALHYVSDGRDYRSAELGRFRTDVNRGLGWVHAFLLDECAPAEHTRLRRKLSRGASSVTASSEDSAASAVASKAAGSTGAAGRGGTEASTAGATGSEGAGGVSSSSEGAGGSRAASEAIRAPTTL